MYERILANELPGESGKNALTDEKHTINLSPHLPWRRVSEDETLGMATASCDHEEKANTVAEKPN